MEDIYLDKATINKETTPLSSGQYGEVYKGKWLDMDIVLKSLHEDSYQPEELEKEAKIMKMLNHPYVVQIMFNFFFYRYYLGSILWII